ncbi:MAG: hypothetical protein IPJ65_06825 [Archangiaceae bacterium]|nr:hypothetical protein [Archangiaceae bacterium]
MNLRLALFVGLAATSCSHLDRDVRQRAAFEFNCPPAEVTVTEVGYDTYGAKGCGRAMRCQSFIMTAGGGLQPVVVTGWDLQCVETSLSGTPCPATPAAPLPPPPATSGSTP